jgi:hypothetical protein
MPPKKKKKDLAKERELEDKLRKQREEEARIADEKRRKEQEAEEEKINILFDEFLTQVFSKDINKSKSRGSRGSSMK